MHAANDRTRRNFLKTSAVLAAGAALAPHAGAADDRVLKIGLIGCGGRGTGAAKQALLADSHVKLVAMGDAFEDRLENSLKSLAGEAEVADKLDVPAARRFVGFDAYKQVIDCGVDVVLLTAPPGFRPLHLQYAVEKNKHVFAEKPVAVDAPGIRAVLATCAEAKKRNLSIVSGLCLRYDQGFRETVQRIHDGAIGDIVALQANDLRGGIWVRPREEGWSDMTWQMRNWYYFTWLSGDFNVEQHVHFLDVCAWLMKDTYPAKAVGLGGRQVRTGPEYGHIFDHHCVTYEYANGVKLFSQCRQQKNCKGDMCAYVFGTRGTAIVREGQLSLTPTNGEKWQYRGKHTNMYQQEHNELFAGIRAGKPINNGEYMCKSTMLAILGRMTTYTGQLIGWEQALNSKEDLSPPQYDWDVKLPVPPVALPGVTKFV
jgi:predicted dehydrogenase